MNSEQSQFKSVREELLAVLPRLYRYARRLSGSASDADDLLQATCERVLARWQQFRPGTEFDRWAFTIMLSIYKNLRRSEAVRLGNGHEDATETLTTPEIQSPERNKIHQQVLDKVQALPDKQRQVMMLVYVEGFSYNAAAEIMDIPVGTVMSRIGRARITLAAELNSTNEKLTAEISTVQNEQSSPDRMNIKQTDIRQTNPDLASSSRQKPEGSFLRLHKR